MSFGVTVSKVLGGIWLALGGTLILAGIFEPGSKKGFQALKIS